MFLSVRPLSVLDIEHWLLLYTVHVHARGNILKPPSAPRSSSDLKKNLNARVRSSRKGRTRTRKKCTGLRVPQRRYETLYHKDPLQLKRADAPADPIGTQHELQANLQKTCFLLLSPKSNKAPPFQ